MGKKTRSQDKNDVFNIPEEDRCSHIRQSVNVTHMKKGLKEFIKYGACQECDIAGTADETPGIYACLLCGHQGCDRSTEGQHALKHFEACRSHSCAINVNNLQVWCYKCDDFKSSQLKSVQDCMDAVAKLFKKESSSSINVSASIDEAVAKVTEPLTNSLSSTNSTKYSKVKGLSNLGNTCFFNSVMQNINQTHLFELQLRKKEKKYTPLKLKAFIKESNDNEDNKDVSNQPEFGEVALDIQLDSCAGLTKSLLGFYENATPDPKKSVFSPSELFGWLCKRAPQFRGYQQQDSHELLRHLLDGIREEEIKRLQAGILKAFNITSANSVGDYKAEQIKAFGQSAKHTTVDEIFGGYFISTVTCMKCLTPHEIYEPFLDLCLPVVDDMSTYSPEKSGRYSREAVSKKDSNNEKIESKYMSKKLRKSAKKLKKQNKTNKMKPLLNTSIGEGAGADYDDKNEEKSKEEEDDDDNDNDDDDNKSPLKDLVNRTNSVELDDKEELNILSTENINGVESVLFSDSEEGRAESEKTLNDLHEKLCEDVEETRKEMNSPISCNDIRSTEEHENIIKSPAEDSSRFVEENDYFLQEDEIIEKKKRNVVKMAMSSLGRREKNDECSIYSCLHQFTSQEYLGSNNKYICDHCNSSKLKKSKETVYTAATKQALIFVPPAILTLQLKRFQQTGKSLKKISKHVSFTELLDLAPFSSRFVQNVKADKEKVLYSLFGIVEHSGGMGGGHYVSYVKVRDEVKDAEKFIQTLLPHQVSTDRLLECMQSVPRQYEVIKDCEASSDRSNCDGNVRVPHGRWFYASDGHVSEVKDVTNILQCQAYLLFYERIL